MTFLNHFPKPASKFFKEILDVLLNRGLVAIVAFVSEIILANYLSTAEKGEIFYIRSNVELTGLVFTFGMGFSIVYFRRKYGDIYDRQLFKYMISAIATLAVFFAIIYPFDEIVQYVFIDYKYYLWACLASIAFLISVFLQKILLSSDNVKHHNYLIFYSKLLAGLGFIAVAIFAAQKVFIMALVLAAVYVVISVYYSFRISLNLKSHEKHSGLISYSADSYIYELIFQVKTKAENFIVLYLLGASVLGVFSVSKNFSAILLIIASSVSLIVFKDVSTGIISFARFKKLLNYYSMLITGITVVSIALNYIVIKWLVNDSFEDAIFYYIPVAVSTALFSIAAFIQSYVNGIGLPQVQKRAAIISLLPFIILLFLHSPTIYPLLIVFLLSSGFMTLYYLYHLRKIRFAESE